MISPLLIVAFAGLGLVALGAVVAPLLRRGRAPISNAGFDRAVYRDQLQEVDRDIARGLLGPEEAASARLEIERRLLAAGSAENQVPKPTRPPTRRVLAGAVVIVVAVWAAGTYLIYGRPDAPDMPFASRSGESEVSTMPSDVEAAAAKLEARLEANGGDAEGWNLLARTESALRRWDKAANAYRHLIPLVPEDQRADLDEIYGEMLVLAAQGIVPPEASDAFAVTLAHRPESPVARYYKALAAAQAGNAKQAIDAWLRLAGELPGDSPMRPAIVDRIAEAARSAGMQAPPLPPPAGSPTTDKQ